VSRPDLDVGPSGLPQAAALARSSVTPAATASCVAMTPTDPPPPNSSSGSPLLMSNCRRTPVAASAELGSAAHRSTRRTPAYRSRSTRHRVLGVPAQAEQQGCDAVTDGRAGDAGPDRVDVPVASKPSTHGRRQRLPSRMPPHMRVTRHAGAGLICRLVGSRCRYRFPARSCPSRSGWPDERKDR
jgi:hypothetical protein